MKKKIVIAGLLNDKNLGDAVIHKTCKYLFESNLSAEKFQILDLDIEGLYKKRIERAFLLRKLLGLKRHIGQILVGKTVNELHDLKKYYASQVKNSSLIVIAGGGLIKYKYQKFWLYLVALISVAEELKIPIALNAVGVEGFHENNQKCISLKNALNQSIVKFVTTRDDFQTLTERYLTENKNIYVDKVADPAVWAAESFGVGKDKRSCLVGLGLIRGGIFKDNEISVGRDEVAGLYVSIIKELQRRNLSFQLFTNGLEKDFELAEEIFSQLGARLELREVVVPKSDRELVKTISQYQGVIAARLHANIISYSLNIPSVGIIWNDKLRMYGQGIGYPERFISPESFKGKTFVDALERAINEGYEQNGRAKYKETVRESIGKCLEITDMVIKA